MGVCVHVEGKLGELADLGRVNLGGYRTWGEDFWEASEPGESKLGELADLGNVNLWS